MAANTVSTFVVASNSPPSAGPMKLPTLTIVLVATFAAVSSSGVRASDGSSAAWAGQKIVAADDAGERVHDARGELENATARPPRQSARARRTSTA